MLPTKNSTASRKRRRLLYILLICFVASIILRETGIFDFSLYKSDIKSNSTANWSDNSITGTSSIDFDEFSYNERCNFGGDLKNFPIYVSYGSKKIGDTTQCKSIEVKIDKISHGLLWTPLYKSTNFTVTASCNDYAELITNKEGKASGTTHRFNCTMTIKGHITITGISSYRKAKNLLVDYVMNAVLRIAREHIRK